MLKKITEKYGPIQYKKEFKHGRTSLPAVEPLFRQKISGQVRLHRLSQPRKSYFGDRRTLLPLFRLRHYNEISDVQPTDDDFRDSLHEVGDRCLGRQCCRYFTPMAHPGLPRFVVQEMMFSLMGIKGHSGSVKDAAD